MRIILKFIAILSMVCLLTACNPETTAEDTIKAEILKDLLSNKQRVSDDSTYIINLWHPWETGSNREILEEYAQNFEKSTPSIQIDVTLIPYAEFTQKVMVSASSGIIPELFFYSNNETQIWAEADILQDITQKVQTTGVMKNAYPEVKKAHMYNGKYYGVPVGVNCLSLFYNTDIVKTPPATWPELMETAKRIKTNIMYGMAISAINNEQGTFQFLPWLWSAGADFDSIDSSGAVKALSFWAKMIDEGVMSRNAINWSQQDVRLEFTSGRAAMMINGPWSIPSILKENPNLKWSVSLIPKDDISTSILGGTSFGIGKGADIDKIWQFVTYIYEPKRYMEFLENIGHYSGDAEFNKQAFYQEDPVSKVFVDQIAVAKARLMHPRYLEISKAIQVSLQEALSGIKTPEKSLRDAAAAIDPLLEKD